MLQVNTKWVRQCVECAALFDGNDTCPHSQVAIARKNLIPIVISYTTIKIISFEGLHLTPLAYERAPRAGRSETTIERMVRVLANSRERTDRGGLEEAPSNY